MLDFLAFVQGKSLKNVQVGNIQNLSPIIYKKIMGLNNWLILIGPNVLRKKVHNNIDEKVASFFGVIPWVLIMFICSFFK